VPLALFETGLAEDPETRAALLLHGVTGFAPVTAQAYEDERDAYPHRMG